MSNREQAYEPSGSGGDDTLFVVPGAVEGGAYDLHESVEDADLVHDLNHEEQVDPNVVNLFDTPEQFDEPEDSQNIDTYSNAVGVDSLRSYVRDIGRYSLLTASEEVVLSKKIRAGQQADKLLDNFNEMQYGSQAFRENTQEILESKVEEGKEAHTDLVNANLRLVISVSKRWRGTLPLLDAVQEGYLGLRRAAEKFDWRRGFKFSTYATWWIRQAVSLARDNQGQSVRLPVHVSDKLRKIYKFETRYLAQNGSDPTVHEISDATGLTVDQVTQIKNIAQPISLETPVGWHGGGKYGAERTLVDIVEDTDNFKPVDEEAHSSIANSMLGKILGVLSPRERMVIELRFGLNGQESATLEEVGRGLGVTRERVRQIENMAFKKVRTEATRLGISFEDLDIS